MKKKKQSPNNVEYLPMELLTEMLAGLPVKSMMQFRCVYKSWHSIISSSDFAFLYFACFHNYHDDENTLVLTYTCRGRTDRWMLCSGHTFKKITSRFYRNLHDNNFKCPFDLGFCLSNNNYEVVAILKYRDPSVHVYTRSTGSWKEIVNCKMNTVHDVHKHGVLIEGIIFWVTNDYDKAGAEMVSFDVNDEVFDYITLSSLDLVILSTHPAAYHQWVRLLDKDHVPGTATWSKRYTIDLLPRSGPDMIFFKENGQFIFTSRTSGIEL
ncbi:hypothetical protein Cgig2_004881 [Carnegiea gigantea]|uniref:F-box domain-containing protein n=1 Tax=Carnegiea gigantea TaxID=171969 RepID=A0A9Q1Q638_9CARY|nr:hypothetical protein Cgig2_004881 [Carnegiea gigantea]